METEMTEKRQGRHTGHLRTKIAAGYILILLLVGGIVHLWVSEWRKLETFETENRRINARYMEVHDVYVRAVELSLLGETVLEWEEADVEEYRGKRLAVDSLLCHFNDIYPAERIDSVRRLLEDKENQLRGIMRVLDEQAAINERIAEHVPVIAWKSAQEEPKKAKRKGLFGIFGKKEKPEPTATTTMLYTLNRDMIARQKAQSHRLSEHADSLAARNAELNRQLQTLIRQMDGKVQADLLKREAEITSMQERSFMQIGGLTGLSQLQKEWLRREGFEVTTAMDEPAARRLVRRTGFDLVLSDIRLPDGDGISLLEWLNKEQRTVPFVIMTEYASYPDAVRAIKLGARDYLPKTVHRERLLEIVNELLVPASRVRGQEKELFRRSSPKAREAEHHAGLVAPSRSPSAPVQQPWRALSTEAAAVEGHPARQMGHLYGRTHGRWRDSGASSKARSGRRTRCQRFRACGHGALRVREQPRARAGLCPSHGL